MNCRHCASALQHVFLDLGHAPASNAYRTASGLHSAETHYPLRLFVCEHCWLVQTEDHASADALFDASYAYFSSTSQSWLAHAARYADTITRQLGLGPHSLVLEVASNDGYLLRNFVQAGIPCLGIEPTRSTAQAAMALGIPVVQEFFGEALAHRLAAQGRRADLIVGNNVFAHVPDINDFTRGLRVALKPGGTVTLEFPHLLQLLRHTQFDTVYHEHFSYLSLRTVCRIFKAAGLRVHDVQELPTHGGSLRIYGCHADDARPDSAETARVLQEELNAGMTRLDTYLAFQSSADRLKDGFVSFLIEHKRSGRSIAAYGAAAKGNTLINYAGVRRDLLPYIADAAPSKQGQYTPGAHIPIVAPEVLLQRRPDTVLILPWNIAGEVCAQLAAVRSWGGQFVVAVPRVQTL